MRLGADTHRPEQRLPLRRFPSVGVEADMTDVMVGGQNRGVDPPRPAGDGSLTGSFVGVTGRSGAGGQETQLPRVLENLLSLWCGHAKTTCRRAEASGGMEGGKGRKEGRKGRSSLAGVSQPKAGGLGAAWADAVGWE